MIKWKLMAAAGLLFMAACGGKEESNTDTITDTDGKQQAQPPNPEVVSCPPKNAAACPEGTVANGKNCDAAAADAVTLRGTAKDFQSGNALAGAIVNILDNDTGAATGICGVTGNDGTLALKVPKGKKIGLVTVAQGAKDTYQFNLQYPPADVTDQTLTEFEETFNSVSEITAQLIPGIIGFEPDPTKGIVAGTIFKSDYKTAVTYPVEMKVRTTGGVEAFYFSDNDLPADKNTQPHLNPKNGLFVIFDVPAGKNTLEFLYAGAVSETTDNTLIAFPDSVAISNVVCVPCR